jgi:hypothetical protein
MTLLGQNLHNLPVHSNFIDKSDVLRKLSVDMRGKMAAVRTDEMRSNEITDIRPNKLQS